MSVVYMGVCLNRYTKHMDTFRCIYFKATHVTKSFKVLALVYGPRINVKQKLIYIKQQ